MSGRTPRGDRLAFYVTSHGFGHLNRAVAVINKVPAKVPVVIRSHPDLFPHWQERLTREAELSAHVSDSGAINPPGDSTATDGPATLDAAARVYAEAIARLDDDARWLAEHEVAAILCDAPALPLLAAQRAAIPGACLVNFTWADIYEPYAREAGGEALELVAALRRAYRSATTVFRCEPALAMSWLPRQVNVGIVANPARDRRRELRKLLGLGTREKLVYFYVGRYGQDGLDWERLERCGDRGVHFVGYHGAPVGPLRNLHVIPAHDWRGSDLIFATDALVAKAGYGTVSEAMAYGRPMIYPPRRGFSEFRALDRSLRAWGGGIPVSSRDFSAFRLEDALDRAFAAGPLQPPYPTDGADRVARELAGQVGIASRAGVRRGGASSA
ncbi:MurG-like transferase [Aquisphaera giovannonii]|uniref:MurG-like transferase n=1 Tax=Aquisphaera giovannonii TaxID=406548 RepID=A0A5B9W6U5_9BACT|nr:hypothetical protein [Aquisphaera giovannonii]QEH36057.1 MurG-like transferase [Aquisphaera giovannonii]